MNQFGLNPSGRRAAAIGPCLFLCLCSKFGFASDLDVDYSLDLNDSSAEAMMLESEITSIRSVKSAGPINYFAITNVSVSAESLRSSIEAITSSSEFLTALEDYNELSSVRDIATYLSDQKQFIEARADSLSSASALTVAGVHYLGVGQTFDAADTFSGWDSVALVNMARNDVLDLQQPRRIQVGEVFVEAADMRAELLNSFKSAIWQHPNLDQLRDEDSVNEGMQGALHHIRSYNSLEESLLQKMGRIHFGSSLIYNAAERDLLVPASVSTEFDVFWLEIPVTFELFDDSSTIEEMYIKMEFAEKYRVLDMVPLMVGVEEGSAITSRTPDLQVSAGGVGVKVGEIFSRRIEFSNIRPTIIGSGLGLNWLSWSLKDSAVRRGSHRFLLILGIPKGTVEAVVEVSGHMKFARGFPNLGHNDIGGMPKQEARIAF